MLMRWVRNEVDTLVGVDSRWACDGADTLVGVDSRWACDGADTLVGVDEHAVRVFADASAGKLGERIVACVMLAESIDALLVIFLTILDISQVLLSHI